MFTLLQVARDPAVPIALVGGIILLVGLFLSFYVNPKEMILVEEDGNKNKIFIKQSKNDKIFERKVNTILEELENR